MTNSIQKGNLPISSPSISTSNAGATVNVGRGETEEFVHFLFREGFLVKGSRMESYDFHSITPSLSYLIQKNFGNPTNGCHTIVSAHSSLALKKQSHPLQGRSFSLVSKPNIKDENVDANSQKISASPDSKPLRVEVPKQFEDWRAHDIGIGFLLYGESACFVLARMIELTYGRVANNGVVTCCVLSSNSNFLENESHNIPVGNATKTSLNTDIELKNDEVCINRRIPRCGIVAESPIGVPGNVFILNPYLEVGEIQAIIELEVKSTNSIKQVFACRPDLVELGMSNFELSTKTPCFLLAVKCSIDLTLPIYVYKRNTESNYCPLRVVKEGSLVVGKDFQLSIEILMSLYTWLKSHLLNPKSPFFDLDYGKFYYTRALELLSNIEYIVRVSGGAEKTISTLGGNINLNDVGLGICGGGSGLSRHFGISKLGTPNSRCSISTVASTNTPVSIGEVQTDLKATNNNLSLGGGLLPGGGTPVQGGVSGNTLAQETLITVKIFNSSNGNNNNSNNNNSNPPVSGRGKRNVKFTNTITPGQNSSSTVSTLVPGTIVRFRSQIPVDAKLIQGVPETDYFTHVQQVYYHFQKGEWRAVYGPSKNRQQKSFSVNKYGFYEAKRLAEEWRLRYLYSNPNGPNGQQNTAHSKCIRCGSGMAGSSGSCGRPACVKSGVDCVCKYNSNGIYEDTRGSGGGTRCRTGRKRRSSRVEMEREVGRGPAAAASGGLVVASIPGCVPTKVMNKGNGVSDLEVSSNYTSKIGEVLSEIPTITTGNVHNTGGLGGGKGGRISETMIGMESRSPRAVSQNEEGEGESRSAESSVYSTIDGMIAFGNAEFSASVPDQKPCAGKISIIASQSPNSKPILHPSISGVGFMGPEPGFKDHSMSQKVLDISTSSTASTTPSNTPGGLAGACIPLGGFGHDQVQKSFESDELLNVSSYGGVGVAVGSACGGVRNMSNTKLASSPSIGQLISSASSTATSSSTPMMISEISSPSISSPVSVGANSCSAIISPDKQQSLIGVGKVVSGILHSISETPYPVDPVPARGGIAYSIQSSLADPGKSGKPSSLSSSSSSSASTSPPQGDGIPSKGPMILSQSAQAISMGFPASGNPYSGHFNTLGISDSYGCISPVIEENCWNSSASNEAMSSSSMNTNSNLASAVGTSSNNTNIGGTISTSTASPNSNTSMMPTSNNTSVDTCGANSGSSVNGKTVPVMNANENIAGVNVSQSSESLGIGGGERGSCHPTTTSGKNSNTSHLSSPGTENISASVVGSRSSVDECSSNHSENDSNRNKNENNNECSESPVTNGNMSVSNDENSDRRNVGSDVNRNNGNPWIKRNAWDEDLIIDSFFVG
ncbi:AP2 domain-containing [Cryptosporidium sp. chipmunk genotype I]|uniref:AP2 domain-containing n=1 Tax=Cryptosporidium sp. chipmunk genotype I TaxID=1280935 RepID=UPI00351A8C38|nr:AP2 domain-containing [Cryptosporidium sp. chipmunk genotype I]